MALKEFIIKHVYGTFATTVITMLVIFIIQVLHMKSEFKSTMQETENKLANDLVEAMAKRERQINRLQAGISQDNLRRWDIIATEKIIKSVNSELSEEIRHQYATHIVDEVSRYGNIDLMVWLSLITQESRFRYDGVSEMGAAGLAQIMPRTARWICKELGIPYHKDIRFDPKMNLKMSAWFLSDLMNDYKDIELVLAHYNGGIWQMNSWKYTRMYKHTPEYKSMTVKELTAKVKRLKESLSPNEFEEKKSKLYKEYEKYSRIRRAKLLVDETRQYVPEILSRAKRFEKFYNEPNSIIPSELLNNDEEETN